MACYFALLLLCQESCFSFLGCCQAKLDSLASGQPEVMGNRGEMGGGKHTGRGDWFGLKREMVRVQEVGETDNE